MLEAEVDKMGKISYAIKIAPGLAEQVRKFCTEHGIKQGFFVEKALKEQLGREEAIDDMLDFKMLKSQEKDAIRFEEYLKRRNR